eukprot:GEMP01028571.1.p1 GENE.GEMP01028571.1~~GEMP01028571.1.p1  ORF type:complete len:500 (+),score=97.97 GEMP01028571.1:63-1562(+)
MAGDEGRLLDGFLLLAAGGSQNPSDIIKANLSSLNIVDIASDDLAYFHFLDELDASDNRLGYENVLEELTVLPAVTDIRLSCNKISSLVVSTANCARLVNLDLSYNELHGDVFIHLCHLNALRYLNMASNCVSSIPPEDNLNGFLALEELILDGNDLVQFAQWRPLDAITTLRKLSLCANRVKRFRDDCTSSAEANDGYFPFLAELDVSQNEICDLESLELLRSFKSLCTVRLDENPIMQKLPCPEYFENIKLLSGPMPKPWYLKGAKKLKLGRTWPKIEYSLRELRKVHSHFEPSPLRPKKGNVKIGSEDIDYESFFVTTGGDCRELQAAVLELTDKELDQHFKDRRERVTQIVSAVEGKTPETYLRKLPFILSAETNKRQMRLLGHEVPASPEQLEREKRAVIERSAESRFLSKKRFERKIGVHAVPVEDGSRDIAGDEEPASKEEENAEEAMPQLAFPAQDTNVMPDAVKAEVREAMQALRQAMEESEAPKKGDDI